MYITPTIFQSEDASYGNNTPEDSITMAYSVSTSILGKRRRLDHDALSDVSPKSKLQLTARGIEKSLSRMSSASLPSPPPESEFGYQLERTKPDWNHNDSPPSKLQRRVLPLKKARPSTVDETHNKLQAARTHSPILTPCHVCYKAPRLKRELDAYDNCWRCDERTCFICMRQCQAGCGKRKVCRQCCVEQGEDGEVQCLDCLQNSEDEIMQE